MRFPYIKMYTPECKSRLIDARDRWLSLLSTTFRASLLTPVELCVQEPPFPLSAVTGEASGGGGGGARKKAGSWIESCSLAHLAGLGDWVSLLDLSPGTFICPERSPFLEKIILKSSK